MPAELKAIITQVDEPCRFGRLFKFISIDVKVDQPIWNLVLDGAFARTIRAGKNAKLRCAH